MKGSSLHPNQDFRKTPLAYKWAGMGCPPSVTGRGFPHPQMLCFLVQGRRPGVPGGAVPEGGCDRASVGTPASSSLVGSSPGDQWLCGVIALVTLSRFTGTDCLPLQVERIGGESRGGVRREDRCPDRWAWPPALPGLMNFLSRPSGRSVNDQGRHLG